MAILPRSDGKFYACVNGHVEQSPFLHLCSFDSPAPLESIPLNIPEHVHVSFMNFNLNSKYLLLGFSNGIVQIRPLSEVQLFLELGCHDNADVTSVSLSFDDSIIVSVGRDGSFFVHLVDLEKSINHFKVPSLDSTNVELPAQVPESGLLDSSVALAEDPEALDILESSAYSLEEAKQKQEEDNRKLDAEKKKETVRARIAQIRTEFLKLVQRNRDDLDESQRLPPSDFDFDPEHKEQLLQQQQDKVLEARRETAWLAEKYSLALAKLRAKFLGSLLVEQIPLSSFRTQLTVSSFRTPELPEFLKKSIEEVHELIEEEAARRAGDDTQSGKASNADADAGSDDLLGSDDDFSGTAAGRGRGAANAKNKKGQQVVSQAQLRKQARLERKKRQEQLEKHKPDENAEDPADVNAIKHAEENMGDFKLKSDKNYIVPEKQRVNAEKKRQQMVLLLESVHFIKMGLNERFLALRDLKRRIIENIRKDNVRLREINLKLGLEDELYEPQIDSSEWPENRDVVSKQELLAFEAEKEKQRLAAAKAKTQSAYGGGDDDDDKKKAAAEKEKKEKEKKLAAASVSSDDKHAGPNPKDERVTLHAQRLSAVPSSEMEQLELSASMQLLQHERKTLLHKIDKTVSTFDQAVADLRQEKFRLDADLKTTDLKLLTLYQELLMLKQFEGNENALNTKLLKCKSDKAVVVSEIGECQEKLQTKLDEIQAWQEKDKAIFNEFNTVVGGEKSEFYGQLLKIFRKRIKRAKKKAHGDNEESEEEEEDDKFDVDDFSDDEGKSDDDDDESCPVNCDNAIYEKVLELRDKRLDQEDALAEINKAVEDLKKQNERLQQRERNIDKELKNTDKDIQAFQTEKQRALNQIIVAVPIKLLQIRCLDENRLPVDISNALIFTQTALQRLKDRIKDIQNEKFSLKKEISDLRIRHKQLTKHIKTKQSEIDVERKKCEDVQRLKLGRIIEPELLERMSNNQTASELKEKLDALEEESERQVAEWEAKLEEAKSELAKITRENTTRLEQVGELTKRQYSMEEKLNVSTKNVHVGDTGPLEAKAAAERFQLVELVKKQANDIEALKAEIHILRRKGGHVWSAAPPVAQLNQTAPLSNTVGSRSLQPLSQTQASSSHGLQSQISGVVGASTGSARNTARLSSRGAATPSSASSANLDMMLSGTTLSGRTAPSSSS